MRLDGQEVPVYEECSTIRHRLIIFYFAKCIMFKTTQQFFSQKIPEVQGLLVVLSPQGNLEVPEIQFM